MGRKRVMICRKSKYRIGDNKIQVYCGSNPGLRLEYVQIYILAKTAENVIQLYMRNVLFQLIAEKALPFYTFHPAS